MNDDRFDRIAMTFASPTRRGALMLAGIALCGLAGILGGSEAETGPGERRRARKRKRKHDRRRKPRKPGPPLYPDLQTLPPEDLRFGEIEGMHVLRFTNTVWNAGEGRLELEAATSSDDDEEDELFQNLYDRPIGGKRAGRRQVDGKIVYHPTHEHYHFADFAAYQLLQRNDDGVFQPIGESKKTSFCITDNDLLEGDYPAQYRSCDQERQGLTPGWRDTYLWNLPEQWVVLDNGPLANGDYRLQSIADPDGLLDEGGGGREENNTAVTDFRVEDEAIQ